jgi:hypothetical protein
MMALIVENINNKKNNRFPSFLNRFHFWVCATNNVEQKTTILLGHFTQMVKELGLAAVVVMHVPPKNRLGHIPSISFAICFLFPLVVHDGLTWIFPFCLCVGAYGYGWLSYVGFVNNKISLYR